VLPLFQAIGTSVWGETRLFTGTGPFFASVFGTGRQKWTPPLLPVRCLGKRTAPFKLLRPPPALKFELPPGRLNPFFVEQGCRKTILVNVSEDYLVPN